MPLFRRRLNQLCVCCPTQLWVQLSVFMFVSVCPFQFQCPFLCACFCVRLRLGVGGYICPHRFSVSVFLSQHSAPLQCVGVCGDVQ